MRKAGYSQIIDEIRGSIIILANDGILPKEYQDHILRRSPCQNHREYHLYDDDILVIYVRKKTIVPPFCRSN
ncbi:type II toxin-antitoxin system YafQ family toxin [Ligilactobacillus agilis]|uniref:type II toxin-antitoxin system YafQ family toxin n=1 Tax=Ligilactobacillus agilis TaxID=1601 RepID=UPI003A4D95F2